MQRGLSYFIELTARNAPVDAMAYIKAFLDGTVFGRLPADQRAAVLVSIADGLEWAGLRENALTLNALARAAQKSAVDESRVNAEAGAPLEPETIYLHVAEVSAWLQLGLLRIAEGDAPGAAEAFRRAHAIEPPRPDAAFLAERAAASFR
jgi:cytochrome c-type biogenesis protein CcmH/NrfG